MICGYSDVRVCKKISPSNGSLLGYIDMVARSETSCIIASVDFMNV